jgi:hypothetical protein
VTSAATATSEEIVTSVAATATSAPPVPVTWTSTTTFREMATSMTSWNGFVNLCDPSGRDDRRNRLALLVAGSS